MNVTIHIITLHYITSRDVDKTSWHGRQYASPAQAYKLVSATQYEM